jgi:hypothetical protein
MKGQVFSLDSLVYALMFTLVLGYSLQILGNSFFSYSQIVKEGEKNLLASSTLTRIISKDLLDSNNKFSPKNITLNRDSYCIEYKNASLITLGGNCSYNNYDDIYISKRFLTDASNNVIELRMVFYE